MLVLSSSWKYGWERFHKYDPIQFPHAKYLDNHLKKKGNLTLIDKTRDPYPHQRGLGIKAYLLDHPEVTNWVVLDDEIFPDFSIQGILPHLIKVDGLIGLTDNDAEAAIKMLNDQSFEIHNQGPRKIITEKQQGPANRQRKQGG